MERSGGPWKEGKARKLEEKGLFAKTGKGKGMAKNNILLETGTNELEVLTVSIDEQLFGINVAKVQALQQFDAKRLTAIPQSPPGVMGMLLYRNTTIPLIDLAAVLGRAQPPGLKREITVVTEFNKFISSFKVHGVQTISRISWEKFVPLNSMIGNSALVTGTVNLDGCEIPVLDLEHILAELFPDLVLEAVSEENLQTESLPANDQLQIVFAEDSTTIRTGVISVLRKVGYRNIAEFENGRDALDYIFNEKREEPACKSLLALITDIEMPRMDGLALCKTIKKDDRFRDLPVIIFSSLINDQMIDKCKSVEADHYVAKPEVNKLIRFLNLLPA
jgi:two-component system chemotaxis response regulator CheV